MLAKYDLGCWAIGMHLPGQCVGDAEQWAYDPRLDNFAPSAWQENRRRSVPGAYSR